MAIKLEKILTISAKEYAGLHDKHLGYYEARGVHFLAIKERSTFAGEEGILKLFAQKVPEGAEVVVGYTCNFTGAGGNCYVALSGTALILKD